MRLITLFFMFCYLLKITMLLQLGLFLKVFISKQELVKYSVTVMEHYQP